MAGRFRRAAVAALASMAILATPGMALAAGDAGASMSTSGITRASSSRYSIEDLRGIMVYFVDSSEGMTYEGGIPCPGFDIHKFDYEYVKGTNDFYMSGIPIGWDVQYGTDTRAYITLTSPDGGFSVTYTFRQPDFEYSFDQLASVVMYVDGEPWSGWDYRTTWYDADAVPEGVISFTGLPKGWSVSGKTVVEDGIPCTMVYFLTPGATVSPWPTYMFDGAGHSWSAATVKPSTDGRVPVLRLYNPNSGEHLYTMDEVEYAHLVSIGWNGENLAFYARPKDGSMGGYEVHRLYNRYSGRHHLTASVSERDALVRMGWTYEGVAFRYADTDTTIWRGYNQYADDHLWTTSRHELDVAVSNGWNDEGIAYGVGAKTDVD